MKKIGILVVAIPFISLFFSTQLIAQRGMGAGRNSGWGPKSAFNKMYNPATVETIKGEILSVEKITPMKGMSYGIHLLIKNNNETISVHLGPAWYFDKNNFVINVKDKVEIVGSRITYGGKPAIIAAEVKKGDEIVKLRDKNGYPLWSGSKRKAAY